MKKNNKKTKNTINKPDNIVNENKKENNESLDKNNIYGKHIMNTSKDENITAKNNVDGLLFHFSLPTGQRIVDIMEYEGITRENVNLKNKISMLEEDKKDLSSRISIMSTNERILKETEEKLQEIIKNKDMTIDELKKENKQLKIRLELLEQQLKESLRKNEENLKKTEKLENKVQILMARSQFDKFVIAIQDLNSHYRLEDNEPSIRNDLINLRDDRVNGCHYLKRGLSQDELDYRINIFIENFKDMDDDVVELFEDIYPGFLDNFEPLISSINKKIPEKQRKIINKWWS